jgi:hypothetical protein
METKPTPGPWEIRENQREEYWCDDVHYNVGPAVGIWDIEDARLISAAPDLLAALRLMVDDHFPDLPLGEQARRLTLADEAIAKATGEA